MTTTTASHASHHESQVAERERTRMHNSGRFKRLFIGEPVKSAHAEHARLPIWVALPVFASDALSSVAYATQEILLALGGAGLWLASQRDLYSSLASGIALAILALLIVVATSYRQTIFAYPQGGGSYRVSRENLGPLWGLIAGGALLIDYVLTVSVSVSSGVQNLMSTPLFEGFAKGNPEHLWVWTVALCCLFTCITTIANLRGLKESGSLFAPPTYGFIVMVLLTVALAAFGPALGWTLYPEMASQDWPNGPQAMGDLSRLALVALVLKAFANGCSAMTGVEAVSDGVPAFRKPESKNASATLVMMATLLGMMFVGITWAATHFHIIYHEGSKAVIEQVSAIVYGRPVPGAGFTLRTFFYWAMNLSTAAILLLAANTSFADFPRLASNMARDNYMPRYLTSLGDRLVYSNGIVILGFLSCLLIVLKKGNTDSLIPLYSVGVFTAFTLSQAGMVMHWIKLKEKGWQTKCAINGVGAFTTLIVLLDVSIEKFHEGAWLVILLIPVLVVCFLLVERHYKSYSNRLAVRHEPGDRLLKVGNTVLVLVPSLNRGVLQALDYAESLSSDCRALHVDLSADHIGVDALSEQWEQVVGDRIPLVVLESPFRSLNAPVLAYLDEVREEHKNENHRVTVVIPEFVSTSWLASFLHSNSATILKLKLMSRHDVIVCNVRFCLEEMDAMAAEGGLAV